MHINKVPRKPQSEKKVRKDKGTFRRSSVRHLVPLDLPYEVEKKLVRKEQCEIDIGKCYSYLPIESVL